MNRKVTAPPAPRADLPTPLAQVLAELDRETQPFRAIHRLIDAVEVLIKLHTVLIVSRFAEALSEVGRQRRDLGLDILVAAIPAEQGPDSEGVTQVVQPGR